MSQEDIDGYRTTPQQVRQIVQFALFLHLGNDVAFGNLQEVAIDIVGRLADLGLVDLEDDL
jgi:hypothetical protein